MSRIRDARANVAAGRERLIALDAAAEAWRQETGDLQSPPRRTTGAVMRDGYHWQAAAQGMLLLPTGRAAWKYQWERSYARWCWDNRRPYAVYYLKPSGWGRLRQDEERSGLNLPELVNEALCDDLLLLYDRYEIDPAIGPQWYRHLRTDTLFSGGFQRYGMLFLPPEPWAVLARFRAAQLQAEPDEHDEMTRARRWIE